MADPQLPPRCFLVEWYQRGPACENAEEAYVQLSEAAARVRAFGAASPQVLLTVSVPTDETVFGVCTAESAEAITALCREAGWPADRITVDVCAQVTPSASA